MDTPMLATPPSHTQRVRHLLLFVPLFLLLALTRIPRTLGTSMDWDEIYTVWQSFGSLDQVVGWVPYDWPPLHYVIVWFWQNLVGPHPFVQRYLSTLVLFLGTAFMVALVRKITKHVPASALAALAYIAPAHILYLSLLVRGYVFIYALAPLLTYLLILYFEKPTFRRALLIAVVGAAMFYIHLRAVFAYLVAGIITFSIFGRRVWRVWLPGLLMALLALPELLAKFNLAVNRSTYLLQTSLPSSANLYPAWYSGFLGEGALVFIVLTAVALLAALTLPKYRRMIAALVVIVALPYLSYSTRFLRFDGYRHLHVFMFGVCFLLALAATRLGRAFVLLASVALVGVMLLPASFDEFIIYQTPPVLQNFEWLAKHWQNGDVVYRDPTTKVMQPQAWEYFARAYFPQGMPMVMSPSGYRRVWYATADGWNLPETKALLETGRIPREYVGPWNLLFRLYEGPPDPVGKLFANGLRFHGMDIEGSATGRYWVAHENEPLKLKLWWSVDRAIEADYSITVQFLASDGSLFTQSADRTGSVDVPKETSHWEPGRFYIDTLTLTTPDSSIVGQNAINGLPLQLVVYQWWDGKRIGLQNAEPGAPPMLPLGDLNIMAW